ncbi:DUF2231 domain-containing protein [Marivirga salinae]|uniref:DUF2231 domain-containing protein n=1 Tax=Marivirga salinarum TaxID=3059078 RepID=A0AA49GBD2_9BACT|nr:DUF2231 domain-containing protein [Marivirga sp. BDSF4-3]WKK77013.2 DUF2231 domain-containing protein [Marivirga sp. BDSF4-3]
MDQTHIHLLINHLPVFGSILGGFVLAHGIWTKSNPTKIAAYNVFIISAIGGVIAFLTGEAAEETAENIQGVAKNMIDQHEDFAVFALVSLIVLGVASILGILMTLKKSNLTRKIAFVILLISLISFGLVARTGYLGGQIRHTELSNDTSILFENSEVEDED